MSVTLNGVTYADADFAGRGYIVTITAGTGASLQRWNAMWVDGLADITAGKVAAEAAQALAETARTGAEGAKAAALAAQTAAEAAQTAAEAAGDRFLAPAGSAPTTRDDATALVAGDVYLNTTSSTVFVWDGSVWVASAIDPTQYLALSGGTMTGNLDMGGFGLTVDAVTVSGNITGTGTEELSTLTVKDVSGKHSAVGATASAVSFDVSAFASLSFEPTAALTVSFTNWPASGLAAVAIEVTGGGDHTLTWTGVTWDGGTAPTLATTTGADVLVFWTRDGGTTIRGSQQWTT